jgi:hypothetical protein
VVGMPGCLPAVHRLLCPLLGVHPTRPAVPGPGVQPVQCPVIWLPRPDAAVRPAGVQPVRRPAVRRLSVRPVAAVSSASAGWWRWGRPRYGGQRSRLDESSSMWSGPSPGGSVDARGAWMRAPLRSRVQGRRGSVGRGPGRVVLQREAAPERPGRPDRREGRCRWRLRSGTEWLARCCRTALCGAAIWAWSHDYCAWSLRSLTSEWTGPEGPNELGGGDGARPQRGPAR